MASHVENLPEQPDNQLERNTPNKPELVTPELSNEEKRTQLEQKRNEIQNRFKNVQEELLAIETELTSLGPDVPPEKVAEFQAESTTLTTELKETEGPIETVTQPETEVKEKIPTVEELHDKWIKDRTESIKSQNWKKEMVKSAIYKLEDDWGQIHLKAMTTRKPGDLLDKIRQSDAEYRRIYMERVKEKKKEDEEKKQTEKIAETEARKADKTKDERWEKVQGEYSPSKLLEYFKEQGLLKQNVFTIPKKLISELADQKFKELSAKGDLGEALLVRAAISGESSREYILTKTHGEEFMTLAEALPSIYTRENMKNFLHSVKMGYLLVRGWSGSQTPKNTTQENAVLYVERHPEIFPEDPNALPPKPKFLFSGRPSGEIVKKPYDPRKF